MSSNPYETPSASLRDAEDTRTNAPPRFPYALVLRWLVGIALVVYGLLRVASVLIRWETLADHAIIDKGSNPMLWLAIVLCQPVAGFFLLRRSHWVFVPILLHLALYAWEVLGFGHRPVFSFEYQTFAVNTLVLAFAGWLWLKGRLR